MKRTTLSTAVTFTLLGVLCSTHFALADVSEEVLKSIMTPDKVETSIGTLEFLDGAQCRKQGTPAVAAGQNVVDGTGKLQSWRSGHDEPSQGPSPTLSHPISLKPKNKSDPYCASIVRGTPISITCTVPTNSLDPSDSNPSLRATNVAVWSATTQQPAFAVA